MTIHPARAVAGLACSAAVSSSASSALAVGLARLLVERGMAIHRPTPSLLERPRRGPAVHRRVRRGQPRRRRGLLLGTRVGRSAVGLGAAIVGTTAGSFGLLLMVVGRDPFAPAATARSTADGIGILAAFTAFYVVVLVAIAAAGRPIRGPSSREVPHDARPPRSPPRPSARHPRLRGLRHAAGRLRRPRGRARSSCRSHVARPARAVVAHPVDRRVRAGPPGCRLRAHPPPLVELEPGRLPRPPIGIGVAAYGLLLVAHRAGSVRCDERAARRTGRGPKASGCCSG